MQQGGNTLASNDISNYMQSIDEAKSFVDLSNYFEALDAGDINYVVLRNWDNLPNNINLGAHSDLDLLVNVDDLAKFYYVTQPIHRSRETIINQVIQPVMNSHINIDVRTNRDNYLPNLLADQILESRKLSRKHECYIIGNDELLFCSLLYHAAFQKPKISEEYIKKLLMRVPSDFDRTRITDRDYLSKYFYSKKYYLVEPYDPYVFWIYRSGNERYPGVVVNP